MKNLYAIALISIISISTYNMDKPIDGAEGSATKYTTLEKDRQSPPLERMDTIHSDSDDDTVMKNEKQPAEKTDNDKKSNTTSFLTRCLTCCGCASSINDEE